MKRSGYAVEFDSFDAFVQWAKGKFGYGLTLERIDKTKGWSAENLRWYNPKQDEASIASRRQQAIQWEKIMQPLRKKYAKELAAIQANRRRVFQYEHPDLLREGIVFVANQSV